jgi:alpha-beta hydrolase superfamily lysophospholipase
VNGFIGEVEQVRQFQFPLTLPAVYPNINKDRIKLSDIEGNMASSANPLTFFDHPIINDFIFHPRPDFNPSPPAGAEDHLFPVETAISIGMRFYLSDPKGPHLIFFHGNGEIAADYDEVGPYYLPYGLNLLVADYRGYGKSQGRPTVGTLLSDALSVFDQVYSALREKGRTGPVLVMGRSLGSAPAIEVTVKRQEKISGMIIESGFARALPLLERLGIPVETLGLKEEYGFGNARKIAFITKPTLILHAQYDELIPLAEADLLQKNSGARRKELIIVPGAGHNDIMARGGRIYFETIARFANSLKRRGK